MSCSVRSRTCKGAGQLPCEGSQDLRYGADTAPPFFISTFGRIYIHTNTPSPTMTPFTIGLLGEYKYNRQTIQEIRGIIGYFLYSGPVRVIIALTKNQNTYITSRIIAMKPTSNLQICLAVSQNQWETYGNRDLAPANSVKSQVMEAADSIIVCKTENMNILSPELLQIFILRSDYLVFIDSGYSRVVANKFKNALDGTKIPLPVQSELKNPGCADTRYPPFPEQYLSLNSKFYYPALLFKQCATFIENNDFAIPSDKVPMVLLRRWQKRIPARIYSKMTPEQILAIPDTSNASTVPMKSFIYAYCKKRKYTPLGMTLAPIGKQPIELYKKFRKLLDYVDDCMNACRNCEKFDLMDFENYDELIDKFITKPNKKMKK